jgi:hypothetical protein
MMALAPAGGPRNGRFNAAESPLRALSYVSKAAIELLPPCSARQKLPSKDNHARRAAAAAASAQLLEGDKKRRFRGKYAGLGRFSRLGFTCPSSLSRTLAR